MEKRGGKESRKRGKRGTRTGNKERGEKNLAEQTRNKKLQHNILTPLREKNWERRKEKQERRNKKGEKGNNNKKKRDKRGEVRNKKEDRRNKKSFIEERRNKKGGKKK